MSRKWPIVPFSELFDRVERKFLIEDDVEYQTIGVRWYGLGAFIRDSKMGMNISRKQQWRVETGDILYNKLFAWKGAFAIADETVNSHIVSDKFPTYKHRPNRIDLDYLRYYFRTPVLAKEAASLSRGAAAISKFTLNPPQFWLLTIPLPPLEEQRRIVARIEALAGKVEEARRLREGATAEANVLVNAVARQKLEELDVEVTELERWLASDRSGIQTGPFGTQLSSTDFVNEGIPVLTIGNVQHGGLDLNQVKYVTEQKAKTLSRFELKEGDILFARMGTVGRSCVVPEMAAGWLYNYHIIRVALDKTKVEPRFIHWIIRASQDVEEYLDKTIRGATREGVNSKIVGSLPCRIPSLERQ